MTEEYQVMLPKLGESIVSATIVQWFKKEGDQINLDEPLLEVSTDKVNSEIPSPVSGVLQKILAGPDQELQVGEVLAVIQMSQGPAGDTTRVTTEVKREAASTGSEMQGFFSPALLRLARENNISLDELEKIPTTGAGGRLSKRDLELYIESRKASKNKPCPMATKSLPADVERIKMSGMRKAIADNMVRSFYEAPHATLITEVDVTSIMQMIQKEKEAFLAKYGAKLTITSFAARAVSKALKDYPFLNSSLEDDTIVVKKFVNVGIAVSVDQGIMVPVVKNCEALSLPEIAKAVGNITMKARSHQLSPCDVQDGTITLTNFGISGVMMGIPIIRYPEVAILGLGAIQKKVVALEDDTMAVRSVIHVSLTFDHRVIDGMYGCGFLNSLKQHLEQDAAL
ncbi:MAG TPA: dihydrolipoamide acetyltransferase family protein [Rhabdochlamydiaceae bacterium]|jgi:2-oxoglutarate dehydrogenase E2 component (dihydrolipoamide succinyltransferase)|nr:dihydrolipoamide acetyltransferase family protein [Rhabdochlamydiaceae bacterium]